MEPLLYISASIALLALAGLFVYLIVFINSTKGLLASVTNALNILISEIGALRLNLQGTIKNLEGIAGSMQDTVERVNAQLDQVEGIVSNVNRVATDATDVVHSARNVVVSVIGFVDNVQSSVQRPINEAATVISALGAWIEAFRAKLGLRGGRTARHGATGPALDPPHENEAYLPSQQTD